MAIAIGTGLLFRVASPEESGAPEGSATPSHLGFVWLVGSLVVFGRAASVGLLSDDFSLLEHAARFDVAPIEWSFWRPLPLSIWGVASYVSAPAAVLHLLNIGLHGANSWLVSLLARQLGASRREAVAAGGIFLCSVLAVEPVVWISGLFDVLLTSAVLTGCVVMAEGNSLSWRRLVVVACCVAGALATKETGVVMPVLLGVVLWWRGVRDRRAWLFVGAMFALACAFALWRVTHASGAFDAVIDRRFVKDFLFRPVAAFGLPVDARVHESASIAVLVWVAAMAVLAGQWLYARRVGAGSTRTVFLAGLWIYVSLVPALAYVYVTEHLEGSRFFYLAAVGWAIALASIAFKSEGAWAARLNPVLVLLVLGLSAGAISHQIGHWRRAANVRDRVLNDLAAAATGASCHPRHVRGVPESLDGAHLLRNGAPAALRRQFGKLGTRPCLLIWSEDSVRIEPE